VADRPDINRLAEIRAYLAKDAAVTDMPRLHPSSPTAMLRDLLADRDRLQIELDIMREDRDRYERNWMTMSVERDDLVADRDRLAEALDRLVETATARVKLPHAPPEGHGAYMEWCAVKNAHIEAIEAGRGALSAADRSGP
jgi:hypothetical protein